MKNVAMHYNNGITDFWENVERVHVGHDETMVELLDGTCAYYWTRNLDKVELTEESRREWLERKYG